MLWLILLVLLPVSLSARATGEGDGVLRVGAVQFAVYPGRYASAEEFRRAVESVLDDLETEAARSGSGRPLDLAVFPEYTSVFTALFCLSRDERETLARNPADAGDIISRALACSRPLTQNLWRELAAGRGYAILAGTTLVELTDGEIRNRALLFDANGNLMYIQDKVFPGDPEKEILNLSTGHLSEVRPNTIDGRSIVFTICRDTYHEVWEEYLPPADLWIDIKANELPYSRIYYDGALPARLRSSPIDHGLTVSLAGDMLGFHFTGVSEYLMDDEVVTSTGPEERDAVLVVDL